MLNAKQIIAIVGVAVLMVVLFLQPVKSLIKEDEATNVESASVSNADMFSLESVSEIAKQGLSADLTRTIEDVEDELATASEDEKLTVYKKLATVWLDVNKPMPAAYVYEEVSQKESSLENWLKTGDLFTDSYQHLSDTVMAPVLMEHAKNAYEKVLELDEQNLNAKAGLATALVNGATPMAGITMLLEVVEQEPEHLKANYNLGLFSMKSRQFDKAVDRFNTVLKQTPNDAEVWFYLATSYENIGLNQDAIQAYEKSKTLAADPSLSQFIDRKITELSN